MQAAHTSHKALQVLAGFDDRTCRGSVLVWNNVSTATEAAISITNAPFSAVSVVEWRLDDFHPIGVSLILRTCADMAAWGMLVALCCTAHLSSFDNQAPYVEDACV